MATCKQNIQISILVQRRSLSFCNISVNEISEISIPALGTCPHVAAALQAHAVTVGADDHGPAGARAAELLEADVAAQGGHPCYRGEQGRCTIQGSLRSF